MDLKWLINLAYIIGGLYVLCFTSTMLTGRFGKKRSPFSSTLPRMYLSRYAILICTLIAILAPARWFFISYLPCIPDGKYTVDVPVQPKNAKVSYLLASDIFIFNDSEIEDRSNDGYDILREGADLPYEISNVSCYIYRAYWPDGGYLTFDSDVTPGRKELLFDQSSDFFEAYFVTVPQLSDDVLGITAGEKMRQLGLVNLLEVVIVTIAAVIGVIICMKASEK